MTRNTLLLWTALLLLPVHGSAENPFSDQWEQDWYLTVPKTFEDETYDLATAALIVKKDFAMMGYCTFLASMLMNFSHLTFGSLHTSSWELPPDTALELTTKAADALDKYCDKW